MISPWVNAGTVLLPLLYLLLLGAYLWILMTDRPGARRAAHVLLPLTAAVHVGLVLLEAAEGRRLPLGSPLEFASLLAASLIVVQGILELRLPEAAHTGFLVAGLAFVLQLLASLFGTLRPRDHVLLHDPGFAGHVVLILLAYTALSIGFLHAILYLVQSRQLHRRTFGLLFQRLPSLETLERTSVGTVQIGLPLLIGALVWGQLWLYDLADRLPDDVASHLTPYDPKIIASWIIVVVYGVGLLGHHRWGWRGRRMNRLAIAFYLLIVATMGAIHHFFPSFHHFGQRGGF